MSTYPSHIHFPTVNRDSNQANLVSALLDTTYTWFHLVEKKELEEEEEEEGRRRRRRRRRRKKKKKKKKKKKEKKSAKSRFFTSRGAYLNLRYMAVL